MAFEKTSDMQTAALSSNSAENDFVLSPQSSQQVESQEQLAFQNDEWCSFLENGPGTDHQRIERSHCAKFLTGFPSPLRIILALS